MGKGKNRAISVQLSIKAPTGTPPAIIRQALDHKCQTGEDTPGITIEIVDWTGRAGDASIDQADAFRKLKGVIRAAHLRKDREG
jgi:hypothetical protein